MDDSPRSTILIHLANQVRRAACEVSRITDAVYGMDDPLIRENLDQLRVVEQSLRSLAKGHAVEAPEPRPAVAEAVCEVGR